MQRYRYSEIAKAAAYQLGIKMVGAKVLVCSIVVDSQDLVNTLSHKDYYPTTYNTRYKNILKSILQFDYDIIFQEYEMEDGTTELELRGPIRNITKFITDTWKDKTKQKEYIDSLACYNFTDADLTDRMKKHDW